MDSHVYSQLLTCKLCISSLAIHAKTVHIAHVYTNHELSI